MIFSPSERFSIKQTSRDRSKQWRDRFQQQCRDRIQSARWNKVDQRRQEKLWEITIKDELESFKQMHEEALKQEGILDEDLIFEDMDGLTLFTPPSSQQQQRQQQHSNNNNNLSYEEYDPEDEYNYLNSTPILVCVNCLQASLQPDESLSHNNKLVCPNCKFRATEQTFHSIQNTIMQHSQQCSGKIKYSPEPASDAILGLCDTCDIMNIF
ncbi:hypothetical protein BDC45DRAFT_499873 [Circinella umbellata]|nr:hypothetical protein BDC45DRAFT_499873 [Circinella umbellata]